MNSTRFTLEDQQAFAALSGDRNPLHLDALVARRLLYGAPVAHGIHVLLRGLEHWLEARHAPVQLASIDVEFLKPVPQDQPVEFQCSATEAGVIRLEARSSGSLACSALVRWMDEDEAPPMVANRSCAICAPADLTMQELKGRRGTLALHLDRELLGRLLPRVAELVPRTQVAALLAATRLVGMECPGLHSVFSRLTLQATGSGDQLLYGVQQLDERYGTVTIAIEAGGLSGHILAFRRPEPQQQPAVDTLAAMVGAQEFAGQRALVIGGSRGLGEVAAKLLAMGDAEVLLTYSQGELDAQRIVAEIRSCGGVARAVRHDVMQDSPEELRAAAACTPTHLYYFATPFAFAGTRASFSPELFKRFCDFYVRGFYNALTAFDGPLRVLLPSSVAVETLPADMKEYCAAKAVAEALARSLRQHLPLKIHVPRLPRMRTDQTASLLPTINAEPAGIVLEHLRTLAAL